MEALDISWLTWGLVGRLRHVSCVVWQGAHDGGDVQEELNVAHQYGGDVLPLNMTRDSRMRYITFYEDEVSDPKRKTAVWELDKGERSYSLQTSQVRPRLCVFSQQG